LNDSAYPDEVLKEHLYHRGSDGINALKLAEEDDEILSVVEYRLSRMSQDD